MSSYASLHGELDTNLGARVLRGALGVGLTGSFLTGVWVAPAWIFAASVVAIYLVASAIIDKALLDTVFKPSAERAEQPGLQRTRGHLGRLVRGATAGMAMGGVLGDALIETYVLDALDIFLLNVGGVVLAMSTLFQAESAPAEDTGPSLVMGMSGTGLVVEPQRPAGRRAA